MILAIGNDSQFTKFCQVVGRQEWAEDSRYKSNAGRVQHRDSLIAAMRQITQTRGTAEWIAIFEQAGVPCGPINSIAEVFDDAQVRARGMQISMPHPSGGAIPLVANPIRMSGTPVEYRLAPPLLGQHTEAVLGDLLGLSRATLANLQHDKVI